MSDFIKNVIKLTSGTVIAQILGILLIPIITRFYGPNEYGVFSLITSISSIIAGISCLAYYLSIMLPKEEEESANLVVLCISLVILTSVITGIVFFIFSDWISNFLQVPMISNYFIFLPIIIFLIGLSAPLNFWLSRRVRYGTIAASRVGNAISTKIISIIAGIIGPSPIGLIFGLIGGNIISNFIMVKSLKNESAIFRKVTLKKMKKLAIIYKKFPLFTSWSSMINSISIQIPVFMLAYYFLPVTVGYYSMANNVLQIPMSLIGEATRQVFYQRAAEEKNRIGTAKYIVKEVYKRLISIGVFPMIILFLISKELFQFLLGPNWATSGIYASILIPWIFLVFISSPLSSLFSLHEKQNIGLFFNIILLISRFISLYIGGRLGDPILALILFSITGVVFWGWMNMYLLKISEIKYSEGIHMLIKYLLIGLFISIPLFLVKIFSLSIYIILFITVVCTIVYYTVIIFDDIILRNEILTLTKRFKNGYRHKVIK
jgi:O-antigen/teichoic acid export membrane protein